MEAQLDEDRVQEQGLARWWDEVVDPRLWVALHVLLAPVAVLTGAALVATLLG